MKRPNESIYTFPCPDCMCQLNRTEHSKPKHSRQYFIITIPQTNPIIYGIQFNLIILHVMRGPSLLQLQGRVATALNSNSFSQVAIFPYIARANVETPDSDSTLTDYNLNNRSNTSRLLLFIVKEVSHGLGQYCSCTWFVSSLSSRTNFEWKTDNVNVFVYHPSQQSPCILLASASLL